MSRTARFAVIVAALASLLGAVSSSASAVTWHNAGSTAFTATGGPVTITRGSVGYACSGSSATASGPGGSTVGNHYVLTGTLSMSPCTVAGQSMRWHCGISFTGTTQFAQVPGVTAGSMGWTCVLTIVASGTNVCHLEGSTPATYSNPSGSVAGRFTLSAASTLTMTNSAAACPLGVGSASITHSTITVTGGTPTTLGPVLTRTA